MLGVECIIMTQILFRIARTICMTGFDIKVVKIIQSIVVHQVFRRNHPHFQKLQNWANLRQHFVNDKGEGSGTTRIGLVNRGKYQSQ